jgi:hypothetical protein
MRLMKSFLNDFVQPFRKQGFGSALSLRPLMSVVAVLAIASKLPAQELSDPVVLIVELNDTATYRGDTSDYTKLGTIPGPTTGISRAFQQGVNIGDIRSVNGQPEKGLWVRTFNPAGQWLAKPGPGQFITDMTSGPTSQSAFNFLLPDGTWIGSLFDQAQDPGPCVITGGGGAFLGIVGERRGLDTLLPERAAASQSEDPSMRRTIGGGKSRFRFILYPRTRPAVQVTANGPAISHSDYSPVTAANPARPGELLILAATGLGPVKPSLDPPGSVEFSGPPYQEVNSPVTVVFNGKELPVVNKIGWPGQRNVYWVDFQVPSDAASGTATLQLTAAWIPGPTVTIPVSTLPIGAR